MDASGGPPVAAESEMDLDTILYLRFAGPVFGVHFRPELLNRETSASEHVSIGTQFIC